VFGVEEHLVPHGEAHVPLVRGNRAEHRICREGDAHGLRKVSVEEPGGVGPLTDVNRRCCRRCGGGSEELELGVPLSALPKRVEDDEALSVPDSSCHGTQVERSQARGNSDWEPRSGSRFWMCSSCSPAGPGLQSSGQIMPPVRSWPGGGSSRTRI
jgi:hypothetical protein